MARTPSPIMEGISSTPTSTPVGTVDSSIGTTPAPSPSAAVVQSDAPVPPRPPLPPQGEQQDGTSKRKNSSIVWQHFEKCKNPDGSFMKPGRSKCKYCPQTYASDSRSNGTSAMRTHVMFQCRKSPIYAPNKRQKYLTFDSADSGDPRYKLLYLEFFFPKLQADQGCVEVMIDEVKTTLSLLFNFYADEDPAAAAASRNVTMPRIESMHQQVDEDSHAANLHQFNLLRQEKDIVVIKNELDKYLLEASEDPLNPKFEILAWWKENAQRYPILSQIAKDVFAVPASTVASEAAFSLGKRVVDPFRASLTPKMVEGLVCLSDWLRGAGFDVYKEPTKDELQMYEELEKLEIDGGESAVSDIEE